MTRNSELKGGEGGSVGRTISNRTDVTMVPRRVQRRMNVGVVLREPSRARGGQEVRESDNRAIERAGGG